MYDTKDIIVTIILVLLSIYISYYAFYNAFIYRDPISIISCVAISLILINVIINNTSGYKNIGTYIQGISSIILTGLCIYGVYYNLKNRNFIYASLLIILLCSPFLVLMFI